MHPRLPAATLATLVLAAGLPAPHARGPAGPGHGPFPSNETAAASFRVALQYSGHLRELCDSDERFGALEGTLRRCRETVRGGEGAGPHLSGGYTLGSRC
jgi:hypothetical protein